MRVEDERIVVLPRLAVGPASDDRRTSGRLNGFPRLLFAFQRQQLPRLSDPPSARPDHNRLGEQQFAEPGMIQVRSISAAVALSRPKLAQETFAAAACAPGWAGSHRGISCRPRR